jgi:hypothetical protein
VTVDIGGRAVTTTVFVTIDAVGSALPPVEPILASTPKRSTPPTMLPTTIQPRFLNGGLGGRVVTISLGDRPLRNP